MRVRTCFVAGALGISAVVGLATIVAAQGLTPAPSPFGPSPTKPPLFGPKSLPRQQQEQMARGLALARPDDQRARVVCGMTVIPAQPSVDPKSIKKAPDDKKYTMRLLRPTPCDSTSVDTVQPVPEPAR